MKFCAKKSEVPASNVQYDKWPHL